MQVKKITEFLETVAVDCAHCKVVNVFQDKKQFTQTEEKLETILEPLF